MSIFSDTVKKAIHDYRQMLRRYLSQAERVSKLAQLNLKDSNTYKNDIALYRTARAIVRDIEDNLGVAEQGYYSYSGVGKFGQHLKNFLEKYEVQGNQVVHRAQKASQALLEAIQLIMLPNDRLTESIAKQLDQCNRIIATFGSSEQKALHQNSLDRQQIQNEVFFKALSDKFKHYLNQEAEPKQIERVA